MSVQIIEPIVMAYIESGLIKTAYLTECNSFWSSTIREHCSDKDIHEEANRLVKFWMWLNGMSYAIAYEKGDYTDYTAFMGRHSFNPSAIQLFKYLQALHYNIELDTLRDGEDHSGQKVCEGIVFTDQQLYDIEILIKWKRELSISIISQLPEYQNARWNEV